MNKIYEGDEWKHAADPKIPIGPTRAEEQRFVDIEFSMGRMSRAEWSRRFDELSNIEKWTAGGRVTS